MTDPLFQIRQERRGRAVTAIGDVLTQESVDAFADLSLVLPRLLAEDELACLAMAALKSLPADTAICVLDEIYSPVGSVPSLDSEHMRDADAWAKGASVPEIKAYLARGFRHLPPRERERFRKYTGAA